MIGTTDSERLLVLAPLGRDAALTCEILKRAGHEALACASMSALCEQLDDAGAVFIAEEALATDDHRRLFEALARQPAWSDLPLVVFASAGAAKTSKQLEGLKALGNATLLERPFGVSTLLSAVNAALRARRRQYQARHAIEQRDQFLAMLGHELRNPLAAISLSVAAFERVQDLTGVKRHVAVVRRQSEHLTRLVDDLLDVSRITSGKVDLACAAVDLNESVLRCFSTLSQPAEQSGLTLTAAFHEEALHVEGDGIRLEQVFTNLLSNAIKYTPSGGHIHVTVTTEEGRAVVRVKDTGIGVAAEMLPVIFDLFTQVPGSLDRSRGGLGIGLTLVKSIVELHGGSVEAKSEGEGTGTELVVRLPSAGSPTHLGALDDAPATAKPVAASSPIVVVDDSVDVREGLTDFLESLGYCVDAALDGPSGLARILDVEPAVALVDIGLPGMDGYEVARRTRAALGERVRLVAISGYGQPKDKDAASEAGFDQHLTKPVDLNKLETLLDVGDRSSRRAAAPPPSTETTTTTLE